MHTFLRLVVALTAILVPCAGRAHAWAFAWRSNIAYVSSSVSNQSLRAALQCVEAAAVQRDFPRAATLVSAALDTADPAARAELAACDEHGCPLRIHLAWLALHYASVRCYAAAPPSLLAAYRAFLNDCAQYEHHLTWERYCTTVARCARYEHLAGQSAAAIDRFHRTLDALPTHSPLFRALLSKYLAFAAACPSVPLDKARQYVSVHDATRGQHASIAYLYIRLCAARQQEVLPLVCAWLEHHAHARPREVNVLLGLARRSLRADDPQGMRMYRNALGTAALRLPPGDRAIELAALLLAERQKLEMISAALTNTAPHSAP